MCYFIQAFQEYDRPQNWPLKSYDKDAITSSALVYISIIQTHILRKCLLAIHERTFCAFAYEREREGFCEIKLEIKLR